MFYKIHKIGVTLISSCFMAMCLFSTMQSALAKEPKTSAKQAYMIDVATGTVFVKKNADELMPPASMAKLMTLAVVFEALTSGKIELDQVFKISKNAWKTGGAPSRTSSMFARVNSKVPVEALLRSVIIQSGNDAAIALAEGIYGSEAEFVKEMNLYGNKIGLKHSNFQNSTGLPHKLQSVTARDLSLLAVHIVKTYPQFLPYFSEKSFRWNKITQNNRNPLTGKDNRIDGLKNGYTDEAGYGLVVSALVEKRRVILVLNGLENKQDQISETKKMLDYAYSGARFVNLFNRNQVIGKASVYGGKKTTVRVYIKDDVSLFLPSNNVNEFKAQINYEGPLQAPIAANTKVGTFKIFHLNEILKEIPIFTTEAVDRGSVFIVAKDAATYWVLNKLSALY